MATTNKNQLVLPGMIDQLKSKFKAARCVVSTYKSKGWKTVVLYQYYQMSNNERVAALYDYGVWKVFKDFLHNVWYTDCKSFI